MKIKTLKNNSKLIAAITFICFIIFIAIFLVIPKSTDTAYADTTNHKLIFDKENLSGDGYEYDASKNLLKLNNFKGSFLQFNSSYTSFITLEGNNKLYININNIEYINNASMIQSLGDLKISGNGSLTIEVLNKSNSNINALDIKNNLLIEEKVNISIIVNSVYCSSSVKANNITIKDFASLKIKLFTEQNTTIAIQGKNVYLSKNSKLSINLSNNGIGIDSTFFNAYNSNIEIFNADTGIKTKDNVLIKDSSLKIISNSINSTGIISISNIQISNSNLTIETNKECIKANNKFEVLGAVNINLTSKNSYSINSISYFRLTEGFISINDSNKNSSYENIDFYSKENTNTQLIKGELKDNIVYSKKGKIKFEYIGASTSFNIIKSITHKNTINEKIIINLENDSFKDVITNDWITNLPDGLTQQVTLINSYSAYILIKGTPTSNSAETLSIRIPHCDLVKSTTTLTVTSNASYNIYSEDFFVRLITNNENTLININEEKNLKNNDVYTASFNDKLSLSFVLQKGYYIKEIYYLNESLEKVNVDINSLSFFMPNRNIILNIILEKSTYKIKVNDDIILNKYSANYGELIIIDSITPKKGYYLSNLYYITTTTNKKVEIPITFPNFTMPDENIIICAEFQKNNHSITIPSNVRVYRDSKELFNKDKIYEGDLLLIKYETIEHFTIEVTINGKKVSNNELYEVTDTDIVITYYKKKTNFTIFYEKSNNYTIEIKSNGQKIENGDYLQENAKININITPSAKHEILETIINGISYKSTNINLIMPSKDLMIYVKTTSKETYLTDNNRIVIIDGSKQSLSNKKLIVTLAEKNSDNYTSISNQLKKYKFLDIIQVQIEYSSNNQNLSSLSLTKTYLKISKDFNLNSITLYSIKNNKLQKENFDIVNINEENYALIYTNQLNDYAIVDTTITHSTKSNLLTLIKPMIQVFIAITPVAVFILLLKNKQKAIAK